MRLKLGKSNLATSIPKSYNSGRDLAIYNGEFFKIRKPSAEFS